MEIVAIEKRTFDLMKKQFDDFVKQVEKLCNNNPKTEWLNNEQVCGMLNISKRTLQSYRDNGTLSYSQIGHKCYYKQSDIENLIEQSQIKK
ncbi:helix-turn-helix domain-containing protein [Dysgonomonas sp. 511]|uniref:helix-turn-helix domain-containing protein n=1 Tax=Dysgonomonas sp. 511 TaxID=2302930 RepID=UPI0013CFA5AD|nr:helix-turn-helix domain-containing protein [Dysgonomonas sp. 511]NDV79434.1 DNA-binding protein [Dysgonomonas sp. 511]